MPICLYKHIYTYKYIENIYMPIYIQITLSISIIQLGDLAAGRHFTKERPGEKIEKKLFERVSEINISFS